MTEGLGLLFDASSNNSFTECPAALQIVLNKYSDDEQTTMTSI